MNEKAQEVREEAELQRIERKHDKLEMHFDIKPSRNLSSQKVKDIYCTMLYSLRLSSNIAWESSNETSNNSGKSLGSFASKLYKRKDPSFSFTSQQAIECLKTLSIKVEKQNSVTNIHYQIKDHLAKDLLQVFVIAKLLHFPQDRTRSLVKEGFLLQPTPKGVSFLQTFCDKNDITGDKSPPILQSNLSSMKLINFERKERTDALIFSEYWIKYLFVLMMGPKPNVWSPQNEPEEIQRTPDYSHTDFSNTFTFEAFSPNQNQADFMEYLKSKRQNTSPPLDSSPNSSKNSSSGGNSSKKGKKSEHDNVSPIYHKYFTNPESDAHVQYYISAGGIRAIKDRTFQISKSQTYDADYCYSGKAIVQWLMDCSDLIHLEEAYETASLFVKVRLLDLINVNDFPKYHMKKKFIPDGHAWYRVTSTGLSILHWKQEKETMDRFGTLSFVDPISKRRQEERIRRRLTLKHILQDPGLKYLFRNHLNEQFCSENLDMYDALTNLNTKFDTLRKLLQLRDEYKERELTESLDSPRTKKRKQALSDAIVELSNECLSHIYDIYNTYLANGVTNKVNINHALRTQIISLMDENTSPIQRTFSSLITDREQSYTRGNINCLKKLEDVSLSDDDDSTHKKSDHGRSPDSVSDEGDNSSTPSSSEGKPISLNILEKRSSLNSDSNDFSQTFFFQNDLQSQASPTDNLVIPSLRLMQEVAPLYLQAKDQTFKMMEADSLPKFLNSCRFDEISHIISSGLKFGR